MRAFQIGVVLPLGQFGPERTISHWTEIREMALLAEAIGFDTVWTSDELLWRPEDAAPLLGGRPRIASLEAICAEEGRDPATIGRSVGVVVHPLMPSGGAAHVLSGSAQEIADAFYTFKAAGYTRLEIMLGPGTIAAMEALAPVLEALDAG